MLFIVGLFKSTALYGIICLLVSIFGLHLTFSDFLQVCFHPNSFREIFMAFLFWSPALYIVVQIINYICLVISNRRWHAEFHFFDGILGRFIASITNPWIGLITLIGASKTINTDDSTVWLRLYCWFQVILHFLWSVTLLGFIGLGFYSLVK